VWTSPPKFGRSAVVGRHQVDTSKGWLIWRSRAFAGIGQDSVVDEIWDLSEAIRRPRSRTKANIIGFGGNSKPLDSSSNAEEKGISIQEEYTAEPGAGV